MILGHAHISTTQQVYTSELRICSRRLNFAAYSPELQELGDQGTGLYSRFRDREAAEVAPGMGGDSERRAVEETVLTWLMNTSALQHLFDNRLAAPRTLRAVVVAMLLIVRFPTPCMNLSSPRAAAKRPHAWDIQRERHDC